jgi:hypothetical protein
MDINSDKNNSELSTYAKLLESTEWRNKRDSIVKRDKNKCLRCSNRSYVDDKQLTVRFAFCHINTKGTFIEYLDSKNKNHLFRKVQNINSQLKNKKLYFIQVDSNSNIVTIFDVIKDTLSANMFFTELSNTMKLVGTRPVIEADEILKKYFTERKIKINWIETKFLNVHHTFYQVGCKPWNYKDESLLTVCRTCHEKIHREEAIFLLDKKGNKIELSICDRCNGIGVLPQYHYIENGLCFKCCGNRFVETLI